MISKSVESVRASNKMNNPSATHGIQGANDNIKNSTRIDNSHNDVPMCSSTSDRKSNDFAIDINHTLDAGDFEDDISDVTEITDTDILLSQQFADEPLSALQSKAKQKLKSQPNGGPKPAFSDSPRSSPKLTTKLTTNSNPTQASESDFQFTRRFEEPGGPVKHSLGYSEASLMSDLGATNGNHFVAESAEPSLFGPNARMTPLSKGRSSFLV